MASSKDPENQALATDPEKRPLIAKESTSLVDEEDDQSLLQDAKDTLVLGVPIFLAMLSWVGMKTTDSALLGHVSADALAAAALSDLWTMYVRETRTWHRQLWLPFFIVLAC